MNFLFYRKQGISCWVSLEEENEKMSALGVKYAYYSLGLGAVGAFVLASVIHPFYYVREYLFSLQVYNKTRIFFKTTGACSRKKKNWS